MRRIRFQLRATALVTFLATALAGCGALPTAPLDESAARLPANGALEASSRTMPIDEPPAPGVVTLSPDPSALPILLSSGALIERSSVLPAALGGAVTNGRWRIEVPSGAVDGTARFAIRVPSAKSGACDLAIEPAEMNHFAVPVTLVADCHGTAPKQLAGWFISWYDPSTGTWVRVPGSTVDLKRKTVSAPLSHFSIYCVGPAAGRSGW